MEIPDKTWLYSHHWDRETFDHLIEAAGLRPNKLHIQVTRRCTHRCVSCNHYLAPPDDDRLDGETLLRLLGEGRRFGMDNLSITGGEPMLRRDILEIIRAARSEGYQVVTVATNGDHLADREKARAVIEAGATHVPISLQGIETHDRFVGVKGSLGRVRRAVENLLDLTGGDSDRVTVGMVATKETLDQLDAVAAWAREVGCGLRINVLDTKLFFFSDGTRTAELWPTDRDAIDRFIQRLYELSEEGLLRLWPRNIVFIERYMKEEPIEAPCPVGLEAVYVAYDGRYMPGCWAKETGATVWTHELSEAWESEGYRRALHDAFRRRCAGCGCTFRTMSAWYEPFIVEGWLRTRRLR